MTFSGAAAAAVIRSEKKIVAALRSANALSSDTAIALHEGRLIERNALGRLLRHKAVLQAGDLFWLDEAGYEEMKNLRRSRLFMVMFGVAAVLIIVSAVTIAKAETNPPAMPQIAAPTMSALDAMDPHHSD